MAVQLLDAAKEMKDPEVARMAADWARIVNAARECEDEIVIYTISKLIPLVGHFSTLLKLHLAMAQIAGDMRLVGAIKAKSSEDLMRQIKEIFDGLE